MSQRQLRWLTVICLALLSLGVVQIISDIASTYQPPKPAYNEKIPVQVHANFPDIHSNGLDYFEVEGRWILVIVSTLHDHSFWAQNDLKVSRNEHSWLVTLREKRESLRHQLPPLRNSTGASLHIRFMGIAPKKSYNIRWDEALVTKPLLIQEDTIFQGAENLIPLTSP